MRARFAAIVLAAAAAVAAVSGARTAARAQEAPAAPPSPCHALVSQPARIGGVLNAVSRYGSTYVLVIPQRLADRVPDAKAAGVAQLHAGAEGGSAATAAARAIGITNVTDYPYDPAAPFQILQDVSGGKLDAAVMWAPLAGFGILELGLDGAVSVFAIDKPHEVPAAFTAAVTNEPCADAIREELDVSGVLPAELLVPVEIRPLLTLHAPAFSVDEARQGGVAFNESCARCHGPDAIADPHGLAPVDLRISIRRFSYPGFVYIVRNGRPQKSMPPLRGTVSDEQIRLIYQYLKARSNKVLTSAGDHAVPAQNDQTKKGTK